MLPARRVQVDGLLHAGRSGVACLSVQNISETDAVEILVTGEDGEGDVYNKHLAAAGATKGLGTDMDLTRYSQYNIYIRALDDGTPDVLLTEGLWDRAELSRQP